MPCRDEHNHLSCGTRRPWKTLDEPRHICASLHHSCLFAASAAEPCWLLPSPPLKARSTPKPKTPLWRRTHERAGFCASCPCHTPTPSSSSRAPSNPLSMITCKSTAGLARASPLKPCRILVQRSPRPTHKMKTIPPPGRRARRRRRTQTPRAARAGASSSRLLLERDLVAERERNALRLGADADVAGQLAVRLLLHAHVDERVLAKHALGVQVGRQVPAGACARMRARAASERITPSQQALDARAAGGRRSRPESRHGEPRDHEQQCWAARGPGRQRGGGGGGRGQPGARERGARRAPSSAVVGVRQRMLVVATMCCRNSLQSVKEVLTATLFSHSNSAHMFLQEKRRASASRRGARWCTGTGAGAGAHALALDRWCAPVCIAAAASPPRRKQAPGEHTGQARIALEWPSCALGRARARTVAGARAGDACLT